MRILVSLSRYSGLTGPEGVETSRRDGDHGATGARKVVALVRRGVRLAAQARTADRLVLVTAGLELFVVAALLPRGRVVAVDWLAPSGRRLDRRWPLSKVAAFGVVRRSDVAMLSRRFGVPADRCRFVPFPVTAAPRDDVGDDGYVYSAGWAHRDWPTLLAALELCGLDALLSMPVKPAALPPRVRAVTQLPPAEGRAWMARSRCVVLAFVDTDLPSGPLVLLDAMAHGKAGVVSDVGGARDYVTDGEDALVVPPGDAEALAAALRRLDDDPALRERLGAAARARAAGCTESRFWAEVLDLCASTSDAALAAPAARAGR